MRLIEGFWLHSTLVARDRRANSLAQARCYLFGANCWLFAPFSGLIGQLLWCWFEAVSSDPILLWILGFLCMKFRVGVPSSVLHFAVSLAIAGIRHPEGAYWRATASYTCSACTTGDDIFMRPRLVIYHICAFVLACRFHSLFPPALESQLCSNYEVRLSIWNRSSSWLPIDFLLI